MNLKIILKSDFLNILREGLMAILFPMPLFLALALRFGLPSLRELLTPYFDLSRFHPLILMFLLNLGPLLTGMISGLLLVDEGDNQIYPAVSVTPVGKKGFLFLRLFSPYLWMVLVLLPTPWIAGLTTGIAPLLYILFIMVCALAAPMEALIIAVLAHNKIEAMAVGKMTGLLFVAPFIAWFVPGGIKFAGTPLPGFWLSLALFGDKSGISPWLCILTAALLTAGVMTALIKRFDKRIS